MVGRTGDDDPGRRLRTSLVAAGVSIAGVAVDETAPSGAALIFVDEAGENSIVVAPGANSRVCPADVDAVRGMVAEAPVVVFQLEIPLATVAHGVRVATGTVVLNPAPAAELPRPTFSPRSTCWFPIGPNWPSSPATKLPRRSRR